MKKTFFRICIIFVLSYSCKFKTETPSEITKDYLLLFTTRKSNGDIKIDSFATQGNDSTAYLEGKEIFGRYMTDFTVAKYLESPEPISFKVVDENGNDVLNNLGKKTIKIIDSIAIIKIEHTKNSIYDSTGQIRTFDSDQKGIRYIIDSIISENKGQEKPKR